ncbi:MAG TPA: hypothetical protein VJA25_11975 [Dehalococcoidia bacterium]|nr:hypothetical protein [Dehalococcoidia bacterium]
MTAAQQLVEKLLQQQRHSPLLPTIYGQKLVEYGKLVKAGKTEDAKTKYLAEFLEAMSTKAPEVTAELLPEQEAELKSIGIL